MIVAAIGAVRGNFPALDRALNAIDEAGIELVYCTGDLVAGGAQGADAIDRLRDRGVVCVQGREDKLVLRARRKEASMRKKMPAEEVEAILQAHASLRSDQVEWLRSLPPRRDQEVDQQGVILCHGSLTSQADPLEGDMPEFRFERQRELAPVDLIICGGARLPFQRLIAGTLFVNPGALAPVEGAVQWSLVDLEEQPYRAHPQRV